MYKDFINFFKLNALFVYFPYLYRQKIIFKISYITGNPWYSEIRDNLSQAWSILIGDRAPLPLRTHRLHVAIY